MKENPNSKISFEEYKKQFDTEVAFLRKNLKMKISGKSLTVIYYCDIENKDFGEDHFLLDSEISENPITLNEADDSKDMKKSPQGNDDSEEESYGMSGFSLLTEDDDKIEHQISLKDGDILINNKIDGKTVGQIYFKEVSSEDYKKTIQVE